MAQSLDFDVAVLGAGIVGASAAYHLAQRGMRVIVIDAKGPAAAASGASDGAVSVASKKPGLMARLANESLIYTRYLANPGRPLAGIFAVRPSYFFATGVGEEAALEALVTKISDLGGPAKVASDSTRSAVLPGLGPAVTRIVALDGEGHMLGFEAVHAYLSTGEIECLWPAEVKQIEPGGTSVTVVTAERQIRAGKIVVAIGVSSPQFFPNLPIVPRAGQLIVTDRAPKQHLAGALTAASYLLAKSESLSPNAKPPVVIDPLATGQFLIGSSRENHGDPTYVDFTTVRKLVKRACEAWPALEERQIIRVFSGIRAAVADGLPVFGRLFEEPNVLIATGFEGDGICLSAIIGREIANLAAEEPVSNKLLEDICPLSPARFMTPEVTAS